VERPSLFVRTPRVRLFFVAFDTMTKRALESSPELVTGEAEVVPKARGPGRPKKESKKTQDVADGKASERVASFESPPRTPIGSGGGSRSNASPLTPVQGMSPLASDSHQRVSVSRSCGVCGDPDGEIFSTGIAQQADFVFNSIDKFFNEPTLP